MGTLREGTAEDLSGLLVLPSKKSQILCYAPPFLINLRCYFENFDYFVNEVANIKVPESSRGDRRMLAWILSPLCAGGVARSQRHG